MARPCRYDAGRNAMKLVTCEHDERIQVAEFDDERQIVRLLSFADGEPVHSMIGLIQAHLTGHDELQRGEEIALDKVTLLAPIPRPARNIFCVGKNYRAH